MPASTGRTRHQNRRARWRSSTGAGFAGIRRSCGSGPLWGGSRRRGPAPRRWRRKSCAWRRGRPRTGRGGRTGGGAPAAARNWVGGGKRGGGDRRGHESGGGAQQHAEPLGFVQDVGRDLKAVGEEGEVGDEDPVEARGFVGPRETAGERRGDERAGNALR